MAASATTKRAVVSSPEQLVNGRAVCGFGEPDEAVEATVATTIATYGSAGRHTPDVPFQTYTNVLTGLERVWYSGTWTHE